MAITVVLKQLQKEQWQASPFGTVQFAQIAQVVFDNSYPSGGYPITPTAFNMLGVLGMTQIGSSSNATPTFALFDQTNSTLRVYVTVSSFTSNNISATLSTLIEVQAGSAVLNNVSPTFLVIGN